MKREREKMNKGAKIALIVVSSIFGFFFLTFVVTFLGGELPWTMHRSSAIFVKDRYDKVDYEGYGQKCYFNENDQVRREQYRDIYFEVEDLGQKFDLKIWCDGIADDKWLRVSYDDDGKGKIFLAKGLLNLYAKWNDIPIFWQLADMDAFEAQ